MAPEKSEEEMEDWRDVLQEEELAAYDRHPTNCRHDESTRVSRDKQLVDYNPKLLQRQPGCQNSDGTFKNQPTLDENGRPKTGENLRAPINTPPDPAAAAQAKFLVEAISALGEAPATCEVCGEALREKQERFTVIHHAPHAVPKVLVYRADCVPVLPQAKENWRSTRSLDADESAKQRRSNLENL